ASPSQPAVGASSRSRKLPDNSTGPAARQLAAGLTMSADLLLGDVPHHRHRPRQPTRDAVLAIGAERLVLTEHDVARLVHDAVLHGHGDLLLLVGIDLARVGR